MVLLEAVVVLKKVGRLVLSVWLLWGFAFAAHAGALDDFFTAIERDDGSTITELLAHGLDPNVRNPEGQVGLFLALQKESYRVVAALMKSRDLRVDAVNSVGETPVMMAALKGSLEWTHQLLLRGAEVNRSGWTALHYAACSPQPKVVSLLLDNGALIDAESPNRTTPLMMAARYGDESIVKVLVDRQADGSKTNEQGLGAADFARLAGREALAKAIHKQFPPSPHLP